MKTFFERLEENKQKEKEVSTLSSLFGLQLDVQQKFR
jgi:hypothetical protein